MDNKVAIIIVNYNGAELTNECVESLVRTNFLNEIKIYIVENGSTDDSKEKITKFCEKLNYNGITIIVNDKNLGFAGGNNIGLKEAVKDNCDYFILLNNDTIVDTDFVFPLIRIFEKYDGCYASVPKIYYENERNKIWYAGGGISKITGKISHYKYNLYDISAQKDKDIEKSVSFATGCCLCLSKECLNNIGFLKEEYFLYEEDTDYSLNILKNNHKIIYVPNSYIYHKVNGSTKHNSGLIDYYMTRNHIIIIKKYFNKKLIPLVFSFIVLIKRSICKEINIKQSFEGYIDGLKYKKKLN